MLLHCIVSNMVTICITLIVQYRHVITCVCVTNIIWLLTHICVIVTILLLHVDTISNMVTNNTTCNNMIYIVLLSNMVTNTYRSVITCCIVLTSNMVTTTYRTVITCCIVL